MTRCNRKPDPITSQYGDTANSHRESATVLLGVAFGLRADAEHVKLTGAPQPAPWDPELGQVMAAAGRVLFEENVADDLGSARRECRDRMLITSERHLRLVLGEYTDHYNSYRPHRALQQSPPAGRPHPPAEVAGMRVLRRDRLGGLICEYTQVACGDAVFRHPQPAVHPT